MSDSSTLQIIVDAAPAEAGVSRVKKAISSMSEGANKDLDKLSKSFKSLNSFIDKTWNGSSLVTFNRQLIDSSTLVDKLKSSIFSLQSTPIVKSDALSSMAKYYSAIEENDAKVAASLRAKGIYKYFDDLSKQATAKSSSVKSAIEVLNMNPSQKGGAWDSSDMKTYFSQLEKASTLIDKLRNSVTTFQSTPIVKSDVLSSMAKYYSAIEENDARVAASLRAKGVYKYFDDLSNQSSMSSSKMKAFMSSTTALPSEKGGGWSSSDMKAHYSQLEAGTGIMARFKEWQSKITGANNELASSFSRISSVIGPVNVGLIAFFAAVGAGYILKNFLDRLIEVNTTFNAFIATMNVVTGSSAKSNAEFQYLSAFADKIGVSIESVIQQYGRLAASMKSVDENGEMTRHVFEAISEASTVLHLKGHETNLLFMALEQSASKGKVSLEEFQRQLANKLPDAMGLASRSMNMTQAEFRNAVTKGTLNVYEVLIKLSNQIKKEYGDSAQYAAQQFTGQLKIMQNAVTRLYIAIGQNGAMDGLTKIVKAITEKLNDPNMGKTMGDSLNILFGQLADWLSKITQSDVQDFFLGLSGIIQSFTAIMRELVGAFSQTVDGKSDFIGFGETVAKMMLIMTDAAMTFLAVIMQLPLSINVVIQDVNVMLAGLKGIKDWATDGLDAAANNINAAKTERNKALALADTNLAILLGSDDSPTAKAWKKTDEIFANMRKQKAAMEADSRALTGKTQIDIRPKTEAEMTNMLKGLSPTPANLNKGMESAYEQERVRLFKTAGVAELEYTNIVEGRLKTEGKNRTELEAKMRFDKDYIAMSKAQKAELLSMADAADKATAKRVAAEQFQSDILSMNKAIYQSEMDLMDIANNRNSIEEKNLRQFEEKLKFDSKYLAMSSQMIEAEREKAKAADALAVSVESARKAQTYHNVTLMQSLDIQRQIEQLKGGSYVSKYTNESQMNDSFKAGGENQFTSEADQQKMLNDARQRDRDMRARDREQMKFDVTEGLNQMKFEMDMQGQTAEAVRRATEARKIEIEIKKLSAGATGEELLQYQELEQFLKGQMNNTLDEFYAKQSSMTAGLRDGISKYLDQISDVSGKVSSAVQRSFGAMEDMLTNFVMTGKLNFKDFIKVILGELVKLMIQLLIIKPLMAMFGGAFGGGTAAASGATTMAGNTTASMMAAKGAAFHDGGVRMFASGGAFANRIVNKPTAFPIGVMGEAGPEAIMPLGKDAQGRLGIRVSGDQSGGNIENNVTISVSIQDGQVKDSGESGNQLGNKLKAVVIGVLTDELRPGGILAKN